MQMMRERLGNGEGLPKTQTGQSLLYTTSELRSHLLDAVTNYFTLSSSALSPFSVLGVAPLFLSGPNTQQTFQLTPSNPLGPLQNLSDAAFGELIQSLDHIIVHYSFENTQQRKHGQHTLMQVQHRWECRCKYDLSYDNGRVEYGMSISNTILHESGLGLIAINTILLIFSSISLVLTVKAVWRSYQAFIYARMHLMTAPFTDPVAWRHLTFSDKLAFFNLWHVTTLIGNVMLVIGCSFTYTRQLGFRTDHQAE